MRTKLTTTNQEKSQARTGLKVKTAVKAGAFMPINHNRRLMRLS